MKKLDEIAIADLMPDSISGDREVSATARAIDPQLKVISEGVDLPLILASIDILSEGVLEHLAAQYDLTAWDSAWPISTKRAVLKTAIADKRKKGTRGAVQRAIEAVAPLATITEWWETDPWGDPHTFKIDVLQDGEAVDAETVADVIAQVNDSKPVRSHFTFSVGQKAEGDMYLSGVIRTIAYARVRSSGMTAVQTEIDAGVLAALRGMNIRRIMEFSHMGDMPEPTPIIVKKTFLMSSSGVVTNVSLSNYQSRMLYGSDGNYMRMEPGWFVVEVFYLTSTGLVNQSDRVAHKTQVMPSNGAYMGIRNMNSYSVSYGVVICRKYEAKKAYFGRNPSSNSYVNYRTNTVIYDENGDKIPYDSAKKYTPSNTQMADGSWTTPNIESMVNVNGYLGYYSNTSGNSCAIYYIEDVPTFTAYLNADKSERTLSPSFTYNWMLYSSRGVKKASDSSSTFALVPPIEGMYLQASSGNLYLKGSPTSEITFASVTYTES